MQLGLCYENCREGYEGVGPVCWIDKPIVNDQQFVNCGMGAALDDTTCGQIITDQVVGPIMAVVQTAELVVTAGASSVEKVATGAAKVAKVMKAIKTTATVVTTAVDVYNVATDDTLDDVEKVQSALEIAGAVDPTGWVSAAAAYTYPICSNVAPCTNSTDDDEEDEEESD